MMRIEGSGAWSRPRTRETVGLWRWQEHQVGQKASVKHREMHNKPRSIGTAARPALSWRRIRSDQPTTMTGEPNRRDGGRSSVTRQLLYPPRCAWW